MNRRGVKSSPSQPIHNKPSKPLVANADQLVGRRGAIRTISPAVAIPPPMAVILPPIVAAQPIVQPIPAEVRPIAAVEPPRQFAQTVTNGGASTDEAINDLTTALAALRKICLEQEQHIMHARERSAEQDIIVGREQLRIIELERKIREHEVRIMALESENYQLRGNLGQITTDHEDLRRRCQDAMRLLGINKNDLPASPSSPRAELSAVTIEMPSGVTQGDSRE